MPEKSTLSSSIKRHFDPVNGTDNEASATKEELLRLFDRINSEHPIAQGIANEQKWIWKDK